MKDLLALAIAIASEAHKHQKDKLGEPYILHPIRVMMMCKTDEERIVAILHDLLEDSAWTDEALLRAGFPAEIVEAIVCLTRQDGEEYPAFIDRVTTNKLATRVKLFDLKDNLAPDRLDELSTPTQLRLRAKYEGAIAKLRGMAIKP